MDKMNISELICKTFAVSSSAKREKKNPQNACNHLHPENIQHFISIMDVTLNKQTFMRLSVLTPGSVTFVP